MAKTFKDRIQEKQKANFIGRSEQIDLFRHNLSAEDPINIFNIYGQGGVGKSHLSRQYRDIALERYCLTAYTDESIKSVLHWMEIVSAQFKEQNAELTDFNERYKKYLQETKKLESDPEKPKGALAGLVKAVTKGAIKEAKKIPGAELVAPLLNEDGIANAVGEWADFVRKKVGNKDEVELVLEPEKVLSPLFWKGVAKHADGKTFACFLIDTFEETDSILENWLLDCLDGKHGDLPPNLLLVIAGRDELNPNRWSSFDDLLQKIPLEPFTDEEAKDYLDKNGITNPMVIQDILKLSGNLPVLLAWLVSAAKDSKNNLTDACETAVERFLKWVDDKDQRNIALMAALPRQLNKDILEILLGDPTKVDILFDWLTKQPFVSRRGDHWAYHSVVRDQMLRYVRTRSPKDWAKQHESLHEYYENLKTGLEVAPNAHFQNQDWIVYSLLVFYHALCAHPNRALPMVINAFVIDLIENWLKNTPRFAEMLSDVGKTNDQVNLKDWGLRIQTVMDELVINKVDMLVEIARESLKNEWIKEPNGKAYLFYVQGIVYSDKGEKEKAIECYQKAVKIKPDFHEAFNNMGIVYSAKGEKEKVIDCFQKAVEIKPDYHVAFNNMGFAFSNKGENEKAVECYQKAVDIKPDFHEAFNSMGLAYSAQSEKEKAIECYQKAIEIKPDYHEAFNNMGVAYSYKGENEKAIECYQKAAEIKPDFHEAFNNMGNAYSAKGEKEKAIECYQKAVEINPDKHEAFYNMGNVYFVKDEKEKAIECYQKTVEINPDDHEAFCNMGNAYSAKGEKEKAIECYQKAIEIKPDYHEALNNMGLAYSAKGENEKAIECYQKAIEIKLDYHEAFYNMGIAYSDKGENEKAIECYQKAVEIKPDYHEAFYNMGLAYSDKVEKEKAIECFQKAINLYPSDSSVFIQLGFNLLEIGRINESQQHFEKAIVLGEIALGNMNLGHIFLTAQSEQAALDCYQKSLDAFSDKKEFWDGMEGDFQYLEQYGIERSHYDSVLQKLQDAN